MDGPRRRRELDLPARRVLPDVAAQEIRHVPPEEVAAVGLSALQEDG